MPSTPKSAAQSPDDADDTGLVQAIASMSLSQVEELQSQEQKRLLNVVDRLRDLGIEDLQTKIPQLIVCGGQSTGKSSVLEAICGVPFPRGESLCTRFASEIALRRESEESIEVTIRPDPHTERSDEELKRVRRFSRTMDSFDEFEKLIESEVKPLMGLQISEGGAGRTFSRDVLCVQYNGPKNQPLTIVDLPGLIHATTDAQNEDDPRLVYEMNQRYMSNPASIILTVVTANNDWETQAVVQLAKKIDPEGKRNLGIITKLDLLKRGSVQEKKIQKLAQNNDRRLELGWHMVKNIDTAEPNYTAKADERDAAEMDFFRRSPFKADVRTKLGVGIASLRERLSHILFSSIEESIGPLLRHVDEQVVVAGEELGRLGKARPTIEEQRAYLADICQRFLKVCEDAIYGHYMENEVLRKDENAKLRLCAEFMKMHDAFAEAMDKHAAKWDFVEEDQITKTGANEHGAMIQISWAQADEIVTKAMEENRGIELPGVPNRQAVQSLFREYSQCWKEIAKKHLSEVVALIQHFAIEVLKQLTTEETAINFYTEWLVKKLEFNEDEGRKVLQSLLAVHENSPLTVNPRFYELLSHNRTLGHSQDPREHSADRIALLKNETFVNMYSYYKTACNTFIDNVPTLAIWSPIIYQLPKTVEFEFITNMNEEEVRSIAAEPANVIMRREQLQEELSVLKESRDELQRHITARRIGKSGREIMLERPSTPSPPRLMVPAATTPSTSHDGATPPSAKSGHYTFSAAPSISGTTATSPFPSPKPPSSQRGEVPVTAFTLNAPILTPTATYSLSPGTNQVTSGTSSKGGSMFSFGIPTDQSPPRNISPSRPVRNRPMRNQYQQPAVCDDDSD